MGIEERAKIVSKALKDWFNETNRSEHCGFFVFDWSPWPWGLE